MRRPLILAVDSDRDGLDRVEAERERRFAADFSVRAERSTDAALAVLDDAADHGDPVALGLATGVSYRRLGVPEVEALLDAGVFHGASIQEAYAMAGRRAAVAPTGGRPRVQRPLRRPPGLHDVLRDP